MNMKLFLGSLCILVTWSRPLFAEDGAPRLPQNSTLVLPWSTAGIDPTVLVEARSHLDAARTQIIKDIVANPNKLKESIKDLSRTPMLRSHDDFFGQTQIGSSSGTYFQNKVIEPWLCGSGEIYLLAMIESDYTTGFHVKIDHVAIKKDGFRNLLKSQQLSRDLYGRFQQILTNLKTSKFDNQSILKIDLSLLSESHGDVLGSNLCLNFLVLQLFQDKFNFVPQGNRQSLARLKQVFPEMQISRPNRVMHIEWLRAAPLGDVGGALLPSNEISFKLRISDSVFGRFLPEVYEQRGSFVLSDRNNLTKEHFAEVIQYFEREAKVLAKEPEPKVLEINGAWAYLDKGRAWGLHPLDRLVAQEMPKIKGHIIGYFGPEMKLRDANGNPIYEGAIIFIRSGLKDLRVGQSFSFDPTLYPQ